jgi:hypothetical protein
VTSDHANMERYRGRLILGVGMLVAAAMFVAATSIIGGSSTADEAFTLDGLPAEVVSHYEFVASQPEAAARVPCYCGCVGFDHRHLLDCFIKPAGGWEEHATGCEVCRDQARDLRDLMVQGKGIDEIRDWMEQTYGPLGKGTETP